MEQEATNAKQFAKRFFARHMVSGIAGGYEGANEKLYVSNETIERMSPTFSGKPIYVGHQQVDLENLHKADGYVVKSFYNELDGWHWAEIMIVSDAGLLAVNQGHGVSNAYIPSEYGAGGQYLGVDYNQKIQNGEFTHLAIVSNPRYEMAEILTPEEFKSYQDKRAAEIKELRNEKTKEKPMLKFFKHKKEEVSNASDFTDETMCPVGEDYVAYKDLVNAYMKAKQNEMEAEVEVDEEEQEKDNEDALVVRRKDGFGDNEDKKEEETTNAKTHTQADIDAAVAKAVAEAQEKVKNFNELKNAGENKSAPIDLVFDQLSRGKELF